MGFLFSVFLFNLPFFFITGGQELIGGVRAIRAHACGIPRHESKKLVLSQYHLPSSVIPCSEKPSFHRTRRACSVWTMNGPAK